MLGTVKVFSSSSQNGLFINSCFAHCQSNRQDTWFAEDSPLIANKVMSKAEQLSIVPWEITNTSWLKIHPQCHLYQI